MRGDACFTGRSGSHGESSQPWSFPGRTDIHASQKALSITTHIGHPPERISERGRYFFFAGFSFSALNLVSTVIDRASIMPFAWAAYFPSGANSRYF